MKQFDPEQLYCAVALTFLVSFFGACQLMKTYQVDPLKKTAIEKGYASYTIPNTNEPTMSVFTWK